MEMERVQPLVKVTQWVSGKAGNATQTFWLPRPSSDHQTTHSWPGWNKLVCLSIRRELSETAIYLFPFQTFACHLFHQLMGKSHQITFTLKILFLLIFQRNAILIWKSKEYYFFSLIISHSVTLACGYFNNPQKLLPLPSLLMASSFASFSMWPSLYWGRASRGSWQRHVSWTSQALTWLFLLLLFWMLLDHKRTQSSRQLHPTCHLKCSQRWRSNRAPARVQSNFTGDEGKAMQPGLLPVSTTSCQRPQGRERPLTLWAAGPAHASTLPLFLAAHKVVSPNVFYLSCLIINISSSEWTKLFTPTDLLPCWGPPSRLWVWVFDQPAACPSFLFAVSRCAQWWLLPGAFNRNTEQQRNGVREGNGCVVRVLSRLFSSLRIC